MRRFFFNNFYVAGIRSGIQAEHAAETNWATLVLPLLEGRISDARRAQLKTLCTFATQHKTVVILNGGDHTALADHYEFLSQAENPYPFANFTEPGLNDAITSVTVVLPERMYDDVAKAVGKAMWKAETDKINPGNVPAQIPEEFFQEYVDRHYTDWERELLKRMAKMPLAD